MKNQTSLLIILLQFVSLTSFCQLKVVNSGNVGIGTSTPMGKLNVQGGLFLTGNNHVFRFLPDNPGPEIGSSTGDINFWYSGTVTWNNLYAKHYYPMSDSSLKQDISPIESSISIINQLNGKKYHFKPITDSITHETIYDTTNFDFGFIAQEVEQVLPGLVSETKGYKAINYDGIIPFLVEAIKTQQQVIDSINTRLTTVEECCSSQRVTGSNLPNKQVIELSSENSIILKQNDPNPFSQSTTITWYLPEDAKNAKLYFYDNKGRILKTVLINETGNGELLVYCSDLKSGIYTYSLVVNDKVVDSKKMVCSK